MVKASRLQSTEEPISLPTEGGRRVEPGWDGMGWDGMRGTFDQSCEAYIQGRMHINKQAHTDRICVVMRLP